MNAAGQSSRPAPAIDAHTRLAHAYIVAHPAEAARTIERHGARDAAPLLEEIGPAEAAAVLAQVESAHGAALLLACAPDAAGAILSAMAIDAAARLLRRVDADSRRPILARCEPDAATILQRTLDQPADTAAGLMDARGVAVPQHLTASEALARARRAGRWLGTYVYVVDEVQTLTGVVSLRELLTVARRVSLASIMTRTVASLPARAGRATIVAHPGWRRYHELPVVDETGALLGVLRYATVRRLEQELAPDRPPASGFAPLNAVGELYWVGMARVLGSLVAAVGAGDAAAVRR
jgi:Mg/Co/Ni transporter MgtE